jgi:hypothetical protein
MNRQEIIAKLRSTPSQDIPFTGMVLGGVKKGAAYTAAEAGVLGVDTFWVGGKRRAASIAIARVLGLEAEVTAPMMTEEPETPAASVTPLAVAPAPTKTRAPLVGKASAARKAPVVKTKAPHRTRSTVAVE